MSNFKWGLLHFLGFFLLMSNCRRTFRTLMLRFSWAEGLRSFTKKVYATLLIFRSFQIKGVSQSRFNWSTRYWQYQLVGLFERIIYRRVVIIHHDFLVCVERLFVVEGIRELFTSHLLQEINIIFVSFFFSSFFQELLVLGEWNVYLEEGWLFLKLLERCSTSEEFHLLQSRGFRLLQLFNFFFDVFINLVSVWY